LFDNSNWSLSHATQFSWSWGGGGGGGWSGFHHSFSVKEGKILKSTETGFGVGGACCQLLRDFCPLLGCFGTQAAAKSKG